MALGILYYLLIACSALVPHVAEHDFHVSVSEIQTSRDHDHVEVSLRVFLDDLQLALRTANNIDDLSDVDEEALIKSYLTEHFTLIINEQEYIPSLEEIVPSPPAVYFIFHFPESQVSAGDTLTIQNEVFMEIYEDQVNLINIRIGDKSRSYALNKGTRARSFKLP